MPGNSAAVQQQDTLNRYLLYFPRSKSVIPDVHSFTGTEGLSEPWLPTQQINGSTTQFSRLKSYGVEALYECVLEHELALLVRRYRYKKGLME
ncbi:hypothetical protein [Leclercia sp. LSNIH1]|uniref:hypothetical protein n=1 Tax=Leclercia sp. LSNIH1 TaxID=1920114 RepID=UPI001E357540|nr:hypothetical protein [Leclercia sp. LSNIH1]